jgi:hypothetical protein
MSGPATISPTVVADIPWSTVVLIGVVGWLMIALVRLVADQIMERRNGNAMMEATAALKVRAVQVEAARRQLIVLCDQARDHVAVLDAFRQGYEVFRSDVLLDEIGASRHGCDSLTAALFKVDSPTKPMHGTGTADR